MKLPGSIFLDTAYIVALSSTSDEMHAQARAIARQLKKASTKLVTTRAVLLEIGNALARQRFRQRAAVLLEAFEIDPSVEIVPLSEELYAQALALYRARQDKDSGLVDCVSFVIMQERGIREALTSDSHFEQAGFACLLK
jgi:uncharacterized protein